MTLAVPDLRHLSESEGLTQYAAVALFQHRAQMSKPDFQITNANRRVVAEICARLDGLPLAIELAAAHIKLFPSQTMLARLGQRLALLRSLPQTVGNLRPGYCDQLSRDYQNDARSWSRFSRRICPSIRWRRCTLCSSTHRA